MLLEFLKNKEKYLVFIVFILIGYLSYLLLKPFITTIMMSILLVYLFYPLYKKLLSLTKNKTISSLITTTLVVLVILIPSIFIIKTVTVEAYNFYQTFPLKEKIDFFRGYLGDNGEILDYINIITKAATSYIFNIFSKFIVNVPRMIVDFIIMLIALFYLFIEGENLYKEIEKLKIFNKEQKEEIIKQVQSTIRAVIYGNFLTGVIEGLLITGIFFVLGIPNAILWGVVSIVLVILPIIGVSLIWIPATIWLIYQGNIIGAVILALYSLILVSGFVEHILKTEIIGKKANIHPLITILGILGGLELFGIIGIILGPIILYLFLITYKVYLE